MHSEDVLAARRGMGTGMMMVFFRVRGSVSVERRTGFLNGVSRSSNLEVDESRAHDFSMT